jgi:hypothetical protein
MEIRSIACSEKNRRLGRKEKSEALGKAKGEGNEKGRKL